MAAAAAQSTDDDFKASIEAMISGNEDPQLKRKREAEEAATTSEKVRNDATAAIDDPEEMKKLLLSFNASIKKATVDLEEKDRQLKDLAKRYIGAKKDSTLFQLQQHNVDAGAAKSILNDAEKRSCGDPTVFDEKCVLAVGVASSLKPPRGPSGGGKAAKTSHGNMGNSFQELLEAQARLGRMSGDL